MPRTRTEKASLIRNETRLIDRIGQFITIPHTVVKMIPAIGPDAFTLFSYLRLKTNENPDNGPVGCAFPSYTRMQQDLGLRRERISEAIKALENTGLLTKIRQFSGVSLYYLQMPSISPDVRTNEELSKDPISPDVRTASSPDVRTASSPDVRSVTNTYLTKTDSTKTDHSSSAAEKTNVPASPPIEDEGRRQPQKKGDLLDGMLFYAGHKGRLADVAHFPAHVQDILAEYVNLWKVTPPDPKTRGDKGRFEEWIKEGEALLAACGEIGLDAMRRVKDDNQMAAHPIRPGSLVTWCRTAAAKIRLEREKTDQEEATREKKERERAALDEAWARMYPDAAAKWKASQEKVYE